MNCESLLTKDECLKIIRADPELHLAVDHFHIKSFQLEDRSDLFGFAGEYHRLKISLEITVNPLLSPHFPTLSLISDIILGGRREDFE